MAKAYFATKLTENISKTPEGFLICRNVRIARTGYQEYLPQEVGIEDVSKFVKGGLIPVYRSPEEVFSAATIASAEGKDVTDLHPSQMIDVNNHGSYSKGHAQNTRKGEGEDNGYLLADLFIKDAVLINKIENGQREVSCGYNHDYSITDKGIEQVNIVMNHIAIVPSGRAGKEVAIRDAKPTLKKEIVFMDARQKKQSLFGRMLAAFAKDASPEEVAEAAQSFATEEPAAKPAEKDESGDPMQQVLEMCKSICARLDKLEQAEAAEVVTPEAEIDACIAELEKGEKSEKEEGKDGAEVGLIQPEVLTGEELPVNPISGADAASAMLKRMKPVIAAIADPGAKKQACDALLASVKDMMPIPSQKAEYGELLKAQRAKAEDSNKQADPADLGKSFKDKYHRKPVPVR